MITILLIFLSYIESLKKLKGKQEVLKEELAEQGTMLADPPDTNNDDPLNSYRSKLCYC